jgi:hypothetical protein
MSEVRESIGHIIYEVGAELLREKCHAVEHAYLEAKGEKSMPDVAREIVEMQLFRRRGST